MIDKIIEFITGKDKLIRIAHSGNMNTLRKELKKIPILVPICPRRLIDPTGMTKEQVLKLIQEDAEELSKVEETGFRPWVMEFDGKKRLIVFTTETNAGYFAQQMAEDLKKVFPLKLIGMIIYDLMQKLDDVQIVAMNPTSKHVVEFDANLFRNFVG